MGNSHRSRFSNKLKWTVIVVLLTVGAYTAFGFWGIPALVQSTVLPRMSQNLGFTLAAQKVRANPFYLTLGLENLSVSREDGLQLASASDLALNVSSRSLLTFKPVLQSVVLDTPDIKLIREKSGALNWLLSKPKQAPLKETPEKEPTEKKPLQFWVDQLAIKNGLMAFDDTAADFIHQIQDLKVSIEDLGFDKEKATHIDLSARYNEAPVTINGVLRLFDPAPEARLNVQVESLALPEFLKYLPAKPAASFRSGLLTVQLDLDFDTEKPAADQLLVKGRVALEEIAITDGKKDAMITAPKAVATISEALPFKNQWRIETVTLEAPTLRIDRSADGTLNLAHLKLSVAKSSKPRAPSYQSTSASDTNETKTTLDLLIQSIGLKGGRINYTDATWPQPFEKHLTDVTLQLSDFSLNKGSSAPVRLSFNTQAGESARFDGNFGPVPFILDGNVDLTNVLLADYLPFYHAVVGFDYEDGRGDANGRIHFDTQNSPLNWALKDVTLDLRDVVLTDRRSGQVAVHTKQLSAQQCDLIPAEKLLRFEKLTSPGGSLEIVREASGNVNLASLFTSDAKPTVTSQKAKRPSSSVEKEDNSAWQVRFEAMALDNQTVIYKDETVTPTVTLKMNPTAVTAQNLAIGRPKKSRFTVVSQIGSQGQVKLDGELQINPFLMDSSVATKALDLTPFQSYWSENFNVDLASGKLFTNGWLKLALPQGNPFQLSVGGDLFLEDVATVNTKTAQSLLDFKTLDIRSAKLDVAPFAFSSQQINLTDFVSPVIVSPDGRHNFKDLLVTPKSTKASPPSSSTSKPKDSKALPINITQVALKNGRLVFSDQLTKPNFEAQLSQIEGHINNINPTSPADIKMKALWEDIEPVQIEGALNPFTKYPQTLLSLSVKGLSMSPFSPYSGKYLGRDISRGNLSMNLKYKVDGSQLAGENVAVIEDLDLGGAVDSPDAVSLPIELAVSLLKDLNNDIHLDLPVSGDLADPKFRLGRTILRILGNLITKVVTAPFAVIGSVFGGGESLGYVDFEPGQNELSPSEIEKLETLSTVLEKKPTLRLDILGDADPNRDANALQKQELHKMIATAKKPLPETISAETILSLDDYEERIKTLFKKVAESNPKQPRAGEPTVAQMEQVLLDQITISDADLRLLANQRARMVEGFFLTQKQLDPGRFFVLKPDIPSTKKGETTPASQVRFSLR